jgi:hypothetical protein
MVTFKSFEDNPTLVRDLKQATVVLNGYLISISPSYGILFILMSFTDLNLIVLFFSPLFYFYYLFYWLPAFYYFFIWGVYLNYFFYYGVYLNYFPFVCLGTSSSSIGIYTSFHSRVYFMGEWPNAGLSDFFYTFCCPTSGKLIPVWKTFSKLSIGFAIAATPLWGLDPEGLPWV